MREGLGSGMPPTIPQHRETPNDIFEKYRNRKYAVSMSSFFDVYSKNEIAADIKRVREIQERHEPKTSSSMFLENFLIEQVELREWFGENARLIPTSEFDDIINNGDAVLEFTDDNGNIIRILIDITTSCEYKTLFDKFGKSIARGQSRGLRDVKYFESEITDFKGKITAIPVATMGLDTASIKKICEDYSITKKQDNHIIQHLLLDELIHCLIYSVSSAKITLGEKHPVTQKMRLAFEGLVEIKNKKNDLRSGNFNPEVIDDVVYKTLMELKT